jgi:copper chaperone CopZ
LFGCGCRTSSSRFSTEVADAVRQNTADHQLSLQLAKMADKAYVTWGSALGIAGAVAAYVTYDHRSQLDSMKETMATKMEVAEVKGQVAEVKGQVAEVKAQMIVLSQDIQLLKDGFKEILHELKAKGGKMIVMMLLYLSL